MSEQSELVDGATCRYSSFVDILHSMEYTADLYDALSRSCRFFIFLDSDERLVWSDDGDSFFTGRALARRILETNLPMPGTWLTNVMGYRDRYRLDHEGLALAEGARWGKPLISADAQISGMINHNTQIQQLFGEQTPHNLFVLHMPILDRNSRIRANIQKMITLGAISESATWDDVIGMDVETLSPIHAKYTRETQSLLKLPEDAKGTTSGSIHIRCDGTIDFQSGQQRDRFRSFVSGLGFVP